MIGALIKNIFSDKEDDFVFASALLRASESGLIGDSGILSLLALEHESDVLSALKRYSIDTVYSDDGEPDVEKTLASYLGECYKKVERAVGDAELYRFLRLQYDCHNLKSAVKCYFRGTDPSELYSPLGSMALPDITAAVYKGRRDTLPSEMANALSLAMQAYERTLDPGVIDPIIDSAAYAAMIRTSGATRSALILKYVRRRIDLTNILTLVRLSRMKDATNALDSLFIEGGELSRSVFDRAVSGGVPDADALARELSQTELSDLAGAVIGDMRELERASDMHLLALIRESKNTLYGVDVPAAYMIERENEVKNLRIVLFGKRAGLTAEQIKKNLRI